jgi:hypothetical protein
VIVNCWCRCLGGDSLYSMKSGLTCGECIKYCLKDLKAKTAEYICYSFELEEEEIEVE